MFTQNVSRLLVEMLKIYHRVFHYNSIEPQLLAVNMYHVMRRVNDNRLVAFGVYIVDLIHNFILHMFPYDFHQL